MPASVGVTVQTYRKHILVRRLSALPAPALLTFRFHARPPVCADADGGAYCLVTYLLSLLRGGNLCSTISAIGLVTRLRAMGWRLPFVRYLNIEHINNRTKRIITHLVDYSARSLLRVAFIDTLRAAL